VSHDLPEIILIGYSDLVLKTLIMFKKVVLLNNLKKIKKIKNKFFDE